MSNKNGNLKMTLGYVGPGGEAAKSEIVVPFAYQAQANGTVDVPFDATSGQEFSIPFGSIETAAAMVVIRNKTGQSCEVKINGQNVVSHHHDLADSAVFAFGGAVPSENPITAVSLTLKDNQSAAGLIEYHLFGDPA